MNDDDDDSGGGSGRWVAGISGTKKESDGNDACRVDWTHDPAMRNKVR